MKYLFFLTAIIYFLPADAQLTGGASHVSQIESKANQVAEITTKIDDLKRLYSESHKAEADKLAEMKRSLRALMAEKVNVLDELRKGRFCNGCGQTATQLRNGGTYDVEKHFRDNGGTRPAKPEVIARKTEEYDRRIADLEGKVKSFELSENEFTRKRKDIEKQIEGNEERLSGLRQEIVTLSRQYQDAVIRNAKSYGQSLMEGPMRLVAEKHYLQDRITIIKARKSELALEEIKALKESDDKVRAKSEAQKSIYEKEKQQVQTSLDVRREQYQKRIQTMQSSASPLKGRLRNVLDKLAFPAGLSEQEIKEFEIEKQSLQQKLADSDKAIEDEETAYSAAKAEADKRIAELSRKIFEETSDLPRRQREAADMLKKAFQLRAKILDDAYTARIVNLKNADDELTSKKAAARKKFMELASVADGERVRLVKACNKAGTSCYGVTAHGTIVGNWNAAESCAGQVDLTRNGNVVYGCEHESSLYKSYYASLINGLSDSDLQALQKADGGRRYDDLLNKISK